MHKPHKFPVGKIVTLVNGQTGTVTAHLGHDDVEREPVYSIDGADVFESEIEEDPDMYLDPIIAVYGQHCGLNADWCTMTWSVGNDLFICDDECGERVSIVHRTDDENDELTEVLPSVTVAVAEALAYITTNGKA